MRISRVWEILAKFKLHCRCQGWKTSENEDWVESEDNYHNFVWTKEVHSSSFKKIALEKKCVVREGASYHVVEAAYTAWLFSATPPQELVKTICQNPDFSKRIAIYDLSQAVEGRNLCNKLNNTDSHVFEEFENFLEDQLHVKVEPLQPLLDQKADSTSYETMAIA